MEHFETVGSDETLLSLIVQYRTFAGEGIEAHDLWREIADYRNENGKYRFYILSKYNPHELDSQYIADIGGLVNQGYVQSRDGELLPTPSGRSRVCNLKVPPALEPLVRKLHWLAETRIYASQN